MKFFSFNSKERKLSHIILSESASLANYPFEFHGCIELLSKTVQVL